MEQTNSQLSKKETALLSLLRSNRGKFPRNYDSDQTAGRRNHDEGNFSEEYLRGKFLTLFNARKNIDAKTFIASLNEMELITLYQIAVEKLINVWRTNATERPQKTALFAQARKELSIKLKPLFVLHSESPISGKKWGELNGTEWGTIGAKGMAIRKLLGPDGTAFKLVGRDKRNCDKKFADLTGGIT